MQGSREQYPLGIRIEHDEIIPGVLSMPRIVYIDPIEEATHQAWMKRWQELEQEHAEASTKYFREEHSEDLDFIRQNRQELMSQYQNEWIVVKGQKIVVHTPSIDTLLKELQSAGIKPDCYELLFTGDSETRYVTEKYLGPMTSRFF